MGNKNGGRRERSGDSLLDFGDNGFFARCRESLKGQIFVFGLVGVVGFLVNAGLVTVISHWAGPLAAQVAAFPVAASVTWWLNRQYTFGSRHKALYGEWKAYIFANGLGWVINNGLYLFLVLEVPFCYKFPAAAVAVGSIGGMGFNFFASKRFVFK